MRREYTTNKLPSRYEVSKGKFRKRGDRRLAFFSYHQYKVIFQHNIKGTTETRLLSTQIQKLCIYTTRKKKNLVYNFQFQNNKQTERELKVQRDWKSLFGYRDGFLEKLLIYDRKKYYFFTIK